MSTIEAQVIQTLKTSPISATITGKTVTQIRQEIIDHMENTNNPHSVTCDQIGAMPYNKNIVIDENYVHTDNNFSNTYKTELDNLKNNYTTKSEHNNLNSTMKTLLNTKVDKKENFDLSKVKDLRYENNYLTIINQNNIGTKIECTGEKYVQDSINNSIVGNDIASHTLYTEGYLKDGKFIQLENSPIILNSLEDIITHAGYYAIANNLFEIDGKGYRLFYINSSNTNITVEDFINSDNAENHITNNYQINSSNQTVFGNNNIVSANNAITGGTNNINTGGEKQASPAPKFYF